MSLYDAYVLCHYNRLIKKYTEAKYSWWNSDLFYLPKSCYSHSLLLYPCVCFIYTHLIVVWCLLVLISIEMEKAHNHFLKRFCTYKILYLHFFWEEEKKNKIFVSATVRGQQKNIQPLLPFLSICLKSNVTGTNMYWRSGHASKACNLTELACLPFGTPQYAEEDLMNWRSLEFIWYLKQVTLWHLQADIPQWSQSDSAIQYSYKSVLWVYN